MGIQASGGCAPCCRKMINDQLKFASYSFAVVLIRCLNPVPHQLVDDCPVLSAIILQRCRVWGNRQRIKTTANRREGIR
jgi:hypothetical protein